MVSINVNVCEDTLAKTETYLEEIKLSIINEIGRNYMSKKDYKALLKWYTGDLLTNVIDIVKIQILYDIAENYCGKEITGNSLIEEFL